MLQHSAVFLSIVSVYLLGFDVAFSQNYVRRFFILFKVNINKIIILFCIFFFFK